MTWLSLVITIGLALSLIGQENGPQAQINDIEQRIQKLERNQSALENDLSSESRDIERKVNRLEDDLEIAGIAVFLSGIICALWAQYTRRSAWLWFFFGLLLAPIALIALVWQNALGLQSGKLRYWTKEC